MNKLYFLILLLHQISFTQTANIDTSFAVGTGKQYYSGGSVVVNKMIAMSDGKLLVIGQFTDYNGYTISNIVKLNANGTRDATFNPGTSTNAGIWDCAIQTDGKILIVGGFTGFNGISRNRIARLNTNGSLDTSFVSSTGPDDYVDELELQPDGKIIIVGRFLNVSGTARSKIARLNATGSLDTSFAVGLGADGNIVALTLQTDGKILIGGDFVTYNGTTMKHLARLNTNGSLDTTFSIGTGTNTGVRVITLQSDGKLLVGGSFQSYNSVSSKGITRVNTDGSLDTSFTAGTGASFVNDIFCQTDGKILIGGFFSTYAGIAINNFARLNSSGSLDTTLTIGSGFDSSISEVNRQSDGKILVGGSFTTYNGTTRNHLVRITDGTLNIDEFATAKITVFPNPVSGSISFVSNYLINIQKIQVIDIEGRIVLEQYNNISEVNVEDLTKGVYILNVISDQGKLETKFIKE